MIVSREIRNGELYCAAALVRRLGVSASPVREAMLTLGYEDMLEPVRNCGFRVVELGPGVLDEIVEMRVMLEELVRGTEESARAGDVNMFLATDRQFHLGLLELHGNGRLVETVANLRDQTRDCLRHTAHTLTEAAVEHREILQAVLPGRRDDVGDLLTLHLGHIREEWAHPAPAGR